MGHIVTKTNAEQSALSYTFSMEKTDTYYIEYLKMSHQDKQKRNPAYSLRAHAKYLGLSPQVLSEIFRGKRHLPMKKVDEVIEKLALSPDIANRFRQSIKVNKFRLKDMAKLNVTNEHLLSDERHFRIISEWEYYAVITLLETCHEIDSLEIIANKLDIKKMRVDFVVNSLLAEELIIKNNDGIYKKNCKKLSTTKEIPSLALKEGHKEILEIARQKIDVVPVEERFYSASTIAIKKEKLSEAKELIREFRNKLTTFIADDEPNEVYQMNIQLFPLTTHQSTKGTI